MLNITIHSISSFQKILRFIEECGSHLCEKNTLESSVAFLKTYHAPSPGVFSVEYWSFFIVPSVLIGKSLQSCLKMLNRALQPTLQLFLFIKDILRHR